MVTSLISLQSMTRWWPPSHYWNEALGPIMMLRMSPQKQIWTKVLQFVKLRQICQTRRQSAGATLIPPPLPPHCCVSLSQPPIPPFRCSSHWSTALPHICSYSLHSSLLLCIHPHFLQWLLYEENFLYVVQLVLSLQDQEYREGMIFADSCRDFNSRNIVTLVLWQSCAKPSNLLCPSSVHLVDAISPKRGTPSSWRSLPSHSGGDWGHLLKSHDSDLWFMISDCFGDAYYEPAFRFTAHICFNHYWMW